MAASSSEGEKKNEADNGVWLTWPGSGSSRKPAVDVSLIILLRCVSGTFVRFATSSIKTLPTKGIQARI